MILASAPRAGRLAQKRYAKGGLLTLWGDAHVPGPGAPLGSGDEPIVPLVSSSAVGPLGLAHLPRMWLEGVLAAAGRLPAELTGGRAALDALVCSRIGLDPAAFRDRLRDLPEYIPAEAWVRAHAARLDPATIAAVNAEIAPAAPALDLQEWAFVHARLVARRGQPIEPLAPTLSSTTLGPLGVAHLPRMWFKNLCKALGALPVSYRSGLHRIVDRGLAAVPRGVDNVTCWNIGLDVRASAAFIEATLPDYPAYEAWVREHATNLTPAAIAAHNADGGQTRPEKAAAEKALVGFDDPTTESYLLDDLLDWKLVVDILKLAALRTARSAEPR